MLTTVRRLTDVKYIEFGTEIRYLGKSAERLYDVFTQTINKYSEHRSHHEDTDHHINTAAAEALRQITGNFLQTLQDCERLLSNNSKFKRTKANFVDNVVWHSSTELDINKLRQRVHFHQTKINFITKPFELQLQSDIHRELKYLSRNVTEVKKGVTEIKKVLTGNAAKASDSDSSTSSEGPLAIPSDLELRFTKALAVNSPGTFQAQDNLPIREAFDALMFHFDRSTVTFKPNPGLGNSEPEHSQYLNLIKSKWILGKLKESINFRSAGQESFWAECVRKIEGKIRDQLDRFQNRELCAPPLGNLFLLPDNYFSIWVDEVSSLHPSALTEEPPLEEKILELPLSNPYPNHHQFTLTIFRKSDVTFRLVSTTKDGQNQDFYKEESVVINMVHTQLMPNFADSKDVSNDKNNVLICENHSQPREYTLQNLDHVALFQRALTGFRVSHDMSEIKLHIEYQNISKAAVSGNARIQLWHLKPLPKILPPDESPPINNDSSSTAKSAHSPSESANLRRFWTSGTSQYAESIFVSPVIGSCGDGVALLRPELPVLVIFTECENKHNFFHLRCMPRKIIWLRHVVYYSLTSV